MKKSSWGMRCCQCTTTAPKRCVQLGANCLGPAGDVKSGVHDGCVADYCQNEMRSTTAQHQDNRFNTVFQVAAEMHHHRAEISNFGQKLENSNLKVCFVLLYLACRPKSSINDPCSCSCLCVKVTGPYWDMINSKPSGYLVLDLPELIRTLDEHIQLY